MKKGQFIDKRGFLRNKQKKLVHRSMAYNSIYKRNREKYRKPFSQYYIVHKDKNKLNNKVSNLKLILKKKTPKPKKHKISQPKILKLIYKIVTWILFIWGIFIGLITAIFPFIIYSSLVLITIEYFLDSSKKRWKTFFYSTIIYGLIVSIILFMFANAISKLLFFY